jgi:hypothetical protein
MRHGNLSREVHSGIQGHVSESENELKHTRLLYGVAVLAPEIHKGLQAKDWDGSSGESIIITPSSLVSITNTHVHTYQNSCMYTSPRHFILHSLCSSQHTVQQADTPILLLPLPPKLHTFLVQVFPQSLSNRIYHQLICPLNLHDPRTEPAQPRTTVARSNPIPHAFFKVIIAVAM